MPSVVSPGKEKKGMRGRGRGKKKKRNGGKKKIEEGKATPLKEVYFANKTGLVLCLLKQ